MAELHAALVKKGAGYEPRTEHKNPDGSPQFTNRLIFQSSPYLLQHAHNPVNWYSWGEEAFARARKEGKPVLVSIGYSTCHWCHVMEHESFEDEEIAGFINQHFVAIKVDREERPDVDDVYMAAVEALTGGGGWPMTLVLTPDKQPFFGGTYFPPRDSEGGGQLGFLTILRQLTAQYGTNREGVVQRAGELSRRLQAAATPNPAPGVPGPEPILQAVQALSQSFDETGGGFGRAPKFPRPVALELLLRYQRRSGDQRSLAIVVKTLDAMARGGIYDQVGGGFHRYSTDSRWLVPHFEKMLYDNAQLVSTYLSAYQATQRGDFRVIAEETLRYVQREMTSPEGGFYSATDADSRTPSGRNQEGWFFTWTPEEVQLAVGLELSSTVEAAFGVTPGGNFEGRNILHLARPLAEVAKELGASSNVVRQRIATAKDLLYEARRRRPAPLRDDKVLTGNNGLMISAFARASLVLDEPEYQKQAALAASFVLRELRAPDGQLRRSYRDGRTELVGYLDDYAFLIQGLLDLFEASSEPRWLEQAKALQAELDQRYWDEGAGGYFMTSNGQERLLIRNKPSYDGAEPSGNSVAVLNLLRLSQLTSDGSHQERAERVLAAFSADYRRAPTASPLMLAALEADLDKPSEVIVISPARGGDAGPLMAVVRSVYSPNRFVVNTTEGEAQSSLTQLVPSVEDKRALGGRSTAFVCERGRCQRPTSDPAVLRKQLAAVTPLPALSAN
ncbi:MAG: thioredoxin domain-containing protein [Polyangiaceae bacterium]